MRNARRLRVSLLAPTLILLLQATSLLANDADLLKLFSDVENAEARSDQPQAPTPASTPAYGGDAEPLSIELKLIGVRNADGVVHVLLFDDESSFSRVNVDAAVGYRALAAGDADKAVLIDAYGHGPFAVFAYHDENGNQQLDQIGGRPKEGYGYSGALEAYLVPPFSAAANVVDHGVVRLNYLPLRMRR